MRVRVDEIAFDSPADLEDRTAYVFEAQSERAKLNVELELPKGTGTPAAEVLADQRGQLDDYFGTKLSVDEDGDLPLAGAQAQFLRYHFDDDGSTYSGFTAVANLGAGDWVKLDWQFEAASDQVRARVDPVLASFAAAAPPPAAAAPPGSTRREVGDWIFDLDDDFSSPRAYVWKDPVAELRVDVHVHPFEVTPPPDLNRRVADLERREKDVLKREDVSIPQGELIRLELEDDLGDRWFVCRSAQAFEIGDPVQIRWVEVGVQGPEAETARVQALMDDLLASIAVEERQ